MDFIKVFNDFLVDTISMLLEHSLKLFSIFGFLFNCIFISLLSGFLRIFHLLDRKCSSFLILLFCSLIVLSRGVSHFIKFFILSFINSIFLIKTRFILDNTQSKLLSFPCFKRVSNFFFSKVEIMFLLGLLSVEFSLIVLIFSFGFISFSKILLFSFFVSNNSFFNCCLSCHLSFSMGCKLVIFSISKVLICFICGFLELFFLCCIFFSSEC